MKKRREGEEADTMLAMASALLVLVCHLVIMSWSVYYNLLEIMGPLLPVLAASWRWWVKRWKH